MTSTTTTPEQRQQFVDWMQQYLPKIIDYFGSNHLAQWIKDGLSAEYNRFYDIWYANHTNMLNSFIARLTGSNPQFAQFMAKAKNSGDELRGEISIIQNELQQTNNQIKMWQNIVSTTKNDSMKQFASSLLASYTAQQKQVSSTLAKYQQDLQTGLANGTFA